MHWVIDRHNAKENIMKVLTIISIFSASLIFAATAKFFASPSTFKVPMTTQTGLHKSIPKHVTRYI
jgi:hypothetical protein